MRVCVLLALAACRFEVAPVDLRAADLGGAARDLALSGDLGPGPADFAAALVDLTTPDLTTPPDLAVPYCSEPGVVACWRFEDAIPATTARDSTANGNDLTLTNATLVAGGRVGQALSVAPGGLAAAPHTASFDVTQLTIEAWILPGALPMAGNRAGILDEDGQYGLFIYNPGLLRCSAGGVWVSSANGLIQTGSWQHVACTYDRQVLRLYYQGVQVAQLANTAAIATNQPNGAAVGSNSPNSDVFSGLLDEVRVLGVARAANLIAADAR